MKNIYNLSLDFLLILSLFVANFGFADWAQTERMIEWNNLFLEGNVPHYYSEIKVVSAILTMYNSTIEQCDDTPFITASGKRTREGIMANNCYPFGTIVEWQGHLYEIQDRMNARYSCEYFDVWSPSIEEAKKFGRMEAMVVVYGE